MALKKFKELRIRTVKMIDCGDWDDLVSSTYGKPYCFQQQNGCQSRGIFHLTVPDESYDDEMHDKIPEVINGHVMGVKFEKWLERDPKEWNGNEADKRFIYLFWHRNFYPDIQTVANDLYKEGLIEAGTYSINIDW